MRKTRTRKTRTRKTRKTKTGKSRKSFRKIRGGASLSASANSLTPATIGWCEKKFNNNIINQHQHDELKELIKMTHHDLNAGLSQTLADEFNKTIEQIASHATFYDVIIIFEKFMNKNNDLLYTKPEFTKNRLAVGKYKQIKEDFEQGLMDIQNRVDQ